MGELIRKIFYGTIKGIVFLFFPIIWVYNRFFTNAVDDVMGYYWKTQVWRKGNGFGNKFAESKAKYDWIARISLINYDNSLD